MKVVISPAKSLDFENCPPFNAFTQPHFISQSEKLIKKLKRESSKKLGKLMSISSDLAELNYARFQQWEVPFTSDNAKPALMVFRGDVYRGINVDDFTQEDYIEAQQTLCILSGLYGLLKPLDLMQAYRLEMGTAYSITPKLKNLYQFWGDSITNKLNEELEEQSGVLVNLASNEYYKAVDEKKINGRVITCLFKDNKNGEYKTIMTFAKLARGYMTRFIIKNKLREPEQLKTFNIEGYSFNAKLSLKNEFIFTRG